MDFMKVFDQTVREIKREVNLKVLKVPEIEQKVLDATDDEHWGPHGTVMAEIAQGTKKYLECQLIMNVLWTRLAETGKNWRLVYKALAVIEYLVARGSERAVDDIVEHTYQISSLTSFEYVEPSGKDVGLNVRKKSETIVALLNNKDKIQEARDKAATNRDKYVGLSSSELSCKSGGASFSSSSLRSSDRYRDSGTERDSYASNDSYKGKGRYGDNRYAKTTKSKREPSCYASKEQDSPISGASKKPTTTSKTNMNSSSSSQNAPPSKYDEYSDDFDPRGISSAKPSVGSGQVNFFDLLDAPESLPTNNSTASVNNSSEVDLFADAAFVSSMPQPDSSTLLVPQTNVDLSASMPAPDVSGTMDLFADPCPVPELHNSAPDTSSNIFDPFAAIPVSNFDGLDPLSGLTSHHQDPFPHAKTSNDYSVETKSPPKKEAFQVKSGVWSDTLSRGLIDLNITASKKVNLADIGIVGGLMDGSESKDKGYPVPSFSMGVAMGVGSGVSKSATSPPPIDDDDFFSSLSSRHS